jgi:chemotaxis protein CheX
MSCVRLSGDWNGAILLECTRRQARHFTGLILATNPPQTVNDDVRDVLGELANVIGGNMKCGMSTAVRLSMPTVMDSCDYDVTSFGAKAVERFAFQSAEGHFWVTIALAD